MARGGGAHERDRARADRALHRCEVPGELAGQRFDRALAALVPHLSRSQLTKLVRRGRVKVDGRKVLRSNFNVAKGQRVLVHLEGPLERSGMGAGPRGAGDAEIAWLHVDDALAVVDKPAGLLTHAAGHARGSSVAELAVERFGALPSVSGPEARPGIVHRLDRSTSGVLVVARTERALDALRGQFRARSVEKRYLAIVHGAPRDDRFELDRPIAPVAGNRDLHHVDPSGKSAQTAFEVLERYRGFALVECRPSTGRRHQLRVHLASIGHPVAGDELYRPRDRSLRVRSLRHHALHAQQLAFDHPASGERRSFTAPLPPAFRSFLRIALRVLGYGQNTADRPSDRLKPFPPGPIGSRYQSWKFHELVEVNWPVPDDGGPVVLSIA